ncbi:protein WHAT'S THIS FACTOR 9, mitochondrial-like [Rutidosis leptorrhynchoides]|uniref:protein WHAT'S THIS FACTOR 9, mitochondrial-like n=1 Tax=Rutidosis leptorrhynchoides TaxID=125765 RepID=UPI003A98DB51
MVKLLIGKSAKDLINPSNKKKSNKNFLTEFETIAHKELLFKFGIIEEHLFSDWDVTYTVKQVTSDISEKEGKKKDVDANLELETLSIESLDTDQENSDMTPTTDKSNKRKRAMYISSDDEDDTRKTQEKSAPDWLKLKLKKKINLGFNSNLMLAKPRSCLLSTLKLIQSISSTQQCRGIAKVRLKWVKNKGLDHIIDYETDLKAASLLKDAIKRSPTGFLTAKSVSDWQKLLGLTVPVLRFMRRYPTLFEEFPHARYVNLPCFKLTDTALFLDSQEQNIHQNYENDTLERLCKVLMMTKTRTVRLKSLDSLKWDLGLPDNFHKNLIPKYQDHFQFVKSPNGDASLRLLKWNDELTVSALQKSRDLSSAGNDYRQFKRGQTVLAFPMSFPRGYGAQKKVKAWMEEFQKLPYISPYEDSRQIDPKSELMEKRAVGVLHEFLSLTIHKKTKRNYLRSLREELNIPHKFTRLFTRYPGIFYLSLKCKTTTVTLKEGYRRGKLVNPHPLARLRDKFYYVMRTGLVNRGKGVNLLPHEDLIISNDNGVDNDGVEEVESEVDEILTDDDCDNEEMVDGEDDSSDED